MCAEGRLTRKGAREDARGFREDRARRGRGVAWPPRSRPATCLRIAGELRIPKLVLVGDAKQLDAVDAGKPFAQLQQAGMKTAVMDEIMRQRDPGPQGGRGGEPRGRHRQGVREARRQRGRGEPPTTSRARWRRAGSRLSPEERERTGVMAPSHELREGINAHIRERLAREKSRIAGPALHTQRLVSRGYTNAEKALAANYAPSDVVAFHRPYKRLGDREGRRTPRRTGVDHGRRIVHLEGLDGTAQSPGSRLRSADAGAATEVYRDRDPSSFARATASAGRVTIRASGLVNSGYRRRSWASGTGSADVHALRTARKLDAHAGQ